MFHSRNLKYLRSDVRANCEAFLAECKAAGLNVLVTETVRDEEYQRSLVAQGYAAKTATVPTFHSVKAGLAFDICKNIKGHEYDDAAFFQKCGEIGEKIGFTWGGRWKSFPDRPHFQWDDNKQHTSAMIRAGKLPRQMPAYKAAERAFEKAFGKRPLPVRRGGSIPIISTFEKILGIKTVLMGFGLESNAIHSPNENMPLDIFRKGIEAVINFHEEYDNI